MRWHAGRLWFSDLLDRVVRTARPGDAEPTVLVEVLGRPSGLGFGRDGALLVTSMRGRRVLRRSADPTAGSQGALEVVADARPGGWQTLNDMLVDPASGNAYVDAYRSPDGSDAALLRITPDARITVAALLPYPNGMVILPGTGELVVSSTTGAALHSFAVGDCGELEPTGVFAHLPGRSPDGLAVDAEEAVWTSSYLTGEYLRVERGGRITHRIAVDAGDWTVDCELGGEDGDTLFLARVRTTR